MTCCRNWPAPPQVKFVLMNSFSTSDDTKAFLSTNHDDLLHEPLSELLQVSQATDSL